MNGYFTIISRCIAWKTRILHATDVRIPCIPNTFGILKTEATNLRLDSTYKVRKKYCSWWTRVIHVAAVISYHVFLPLVVCKKRKPQIEGGFLRYFLLMKDQVTTDKCQEKYFIENGVYGYYCRCYQNSFHHWYAKNWGHKLTAHS